MRVVIMAGGQGTRFWPASRREHPKQFLEIIGQKTMLQETVIRLLPEIEVSDIFIICSEEYVQKVRDQLPEFSEEQIIVEPLARSTAACVGLAAQYLKDHYGDSVCAFLPADHVIERKSRFHVALQAGRRLAHEDYLVTFGIIPKSPATGYGYIKLGKLLGKVGDLSSFRVDSFIEKPTLERAEDFMRDERYLWNSGIFLWKASTILEEIDRSLPQLGAALKTIASNWVDPDSTREVFRVLDSVSVDYGVLEKSSRVTTIPCDFGWSDVGDWKAVRELLPKDGHGNASNTDFAVLDAQDCLAYSREGKFIALIGVENLVVVDTPNGLLVCPANRTQEVRLLVEALDPKYT